MKKKYLLLGLFALMVGFLFLVYRRSQKLPPGQIPDEYQTLYTELEQKLDGFERQLDSQWDGQKHEVVFAADLFSNLRIPRGSVRGDEADEKNKVFDPNQFMQNPYQQFNPALEGLYQQLFSGF